MTTLSKRLCLTALLALSSFAFAASATAEHGSDWGYCEVNLIGGEQQIADLNAQDNLYTVAEMSADAWTSRVVGVVKKALHAQVDGLETVLAAMCEPQVAIVSLTITEKGYCHSPATGQLMLDHPFIVADLQNPHQPKSAPGVVVEALARRKAAGLPAFSVMSCDNMPENGHVMRNVTCAYARAVDGELADWIESHVTFPSTMVDRIVPAVTPDTLDKIEQLTGVRDPAAVACEPFRQWVIEDNFVAGRPAWDKAGAELVSDVIPFEEMKLRMLNGSHSFLAYLGYLAGYQHINDCMEDENYRVAAHALMLNEQAPTLKVKGVDLGRYADLLIARYSNPALRHRTWQIAMDYGFNVLNLYKLYLIVDKENEKAIHIYRKLGFMVEGELIHEFFINGEYRNTIRMCIFQHQHLAGHKPSGASLLKPTAQ